MAFPHATLTAPKPPPEGYPENPRNVGEHLRKTRMDRGLLQREVAGKIGAHPDTIQNWELGRTQPALRHWLPLIGFLGFIPFEIGDTLGGRIVAWRKLNGVPRSELADRLGVDESTVWRWEAGRTKPDQDATDSLEQLLASLSLV